jgi:hypothetical protein
VPRAVFGVADYGVERGAGESVLVMLLSTHERRRELDAADAINVLGLAALATTGVGFGVSKDKVTVRVQIRATVRACGGGVAVAAANQIDQKPPTPLWNDQVRQLSDRLASCRRLLAGYYTLAALFGPSCRGTTAFSATRAAIANRLHALACAPPAAAIEARLDTLCVRMPPAFPAS